MHDEENAFNNKMLISFQFFDDDTTLRLRKFSVSQVRWSTQANPRRHKITFRELKEQRDFNTQHISTFRAPLDFSRFSFTHPFFPSFLPPLSWSKSERRRIFLFLSLPPPSLSLSFSFFAGPAYSARWRFYVSKCMQKTEAPRASQHGTPRGEKLELPSAPAFFSPEYFSRDWRHRLSPEE